MEKRLVRVVEMRPPQIVIPPVKSLDLQEVFSGLLRGITAATPSQQTVTPKELCRPLQEVFLEHLLVLPVETQQRPTATPFTERSLV